MFFLKRPAYFDVVILSAFTILITLQPYFMHGKINIFELGLYLPGIQSVLNNEIPYRDFFQLRGPFELYVPAFMMRFFGENVAVLIQYFYIGTILTLIMCVVLGKQLLSTRFFYYFAVLVLTAKTFPRVVFTYWGGMSFALGLMAIAFAVQYFTTTKTIFLLLSGVVTACGFWTSLEIGVFAGLAILFSIIFCTVLKLLSKREFILSTSWFLIGFCVVTLPYCIYLHLNGALIPYFENILIVVQNMENTFPQVEAVPKNLLEALSSMINPGSKNFRHLTPAYLYVFLAIYYGFQIKSKQLRLKDAAIICLAAYGFIFYVGSFRNVWSSNFEMILQPEKILLFVLIEKIYFILKDKREKTIQEIKSINNSLFKQRLKVWSVYVLLVGVMGSSIGYSITRMNKRFYAFKYARNKIMGNETDSLRPLYNQEKIKLDLNRVKGLTVPALQAQDFVELTKFVNDYTAPEDVVLMYPEGAAYSFIIDRPFVGRFPMANFSWFNDEYHDEYMASLRKAKAKFAVIPKELPHYFDKSHFIVKSNRHKYDEVMDFIDRNYEIRKTTPTLNILKWREENGR